MRLVIKSHFNTLEMNIHAPKKKEEGLDHVKLLLRC